MEQLIDQIKTHLAEVEAFQSSDPEEIERFRIKFLGKKGSVIVEDSFLTLDIFLI